MPSGLQAKLEAVPKFSLGPFGLKLIPAELEVPGRPKGHLGLSVDDLSEELAKALGAENGKALDVRYVYRQGPAEKAGLQRGDVLVEIQGTPVEDEDGFGKAIREMKPGTKVRLTYLRDGKRGQAEMTVEEQR